MIMVGSIGFTESTVMVSNELDAIIRSAFNRPIDAVDILWFLAVNYANLEAAGYCDGTKVYTLSTRILEYLVQQDPTILERLQVLGNVHFKAPSWN